MIKKLCKVWIDMVDHEKGRKGVLAVNMEHEQIAEYLSKVLKGGFPYRAMTIHVRDLGSLPGVPTPIIEKDPTKWEDLGDD